MKLNKVEILEHMAQGFVLVEKFDRMYGKYYYLELGEKKFWSLNLKSIDAIKKASIKQSVDVHTINYVAPWKVG